MPEVMSRIGRRRAGIREGKGTIWRPKLMTHVSDVVKFGLTSTSKRAFTKRPNLVTDYAVLMILCPLGATVRIFRSRVRLKSQARF